jgi:protein SCO1/2
MRRATILFVALSLAASACAPPAETPSDPNDLPLRGTKPFAPMDKVSFTLADTHGEPFDFRKETDGKIALLFFGYTYCPDVCPMHMATLSTAMRELEPEVREQVRVVFVSVDPERDTPERLDQWLTAFDSSFVGVRGTLEDVSRALAFYRYPSPETSGEEVGYTVGHPALVYAFTPDNLGRAMYGVETPKAVWVHDLNLMAWHRWESTSVEDPGPSADEGLASEEALASLGPLEVLDAYVPRPPAGETAALYLVLRNTGAVADTLLGFDTEASQSTSLHDMKMSDGVTHMVPMAGGLALPAGETVRLAPGGRHGMLEGLVMELEPGSGVDLTLRFARAGELRVTAHIIRYEDMVR